MLYKSTPFPWRSSAAQSYQWLKTPGQQMDVPNFLWTSPWNYWQVTEGLRRKKNTPLLRCDGTGGAFSSFQRNYSGLHKGPWASEQPAKSLPSFTRRPGGFLQDWLSLRERADCSNRHNNNPPQNWKMTNQNLPLSFFQALVCVSRTGNKTWSTREQPS